MAIIIDATGLIVGRAAAFAAKKALLGEKVDVVNCENAVISGDKRQILDRHKEKYNLGGPHWGPFFPKQADRYVRRVIRGMLPAKKGRGKEAFKNVMCWLGVPEEFKGKKLETVKEANAGKLVNTKYIKLSEVMDFLKHRK